ncbi:hypothetical protein V8C37DRAFT_418059 [Trichoderma ceciliae]
MSGFPRACALASFMASKAPTASASYASALASAPHEVDVLQSWKYTNSNIIKLWQYDVALKQLYKDLLEQKSTIANLVEHHLGLNGEDVLILPTTEWIHGSFDICILIQVTFGQIYRKFILRRLILYKLAETQYPGTIDEKKGCEFTHQNHLPWYIRLPHIIRRYVYRLFQYSTLSRYISNHTSRCLPTAYMLLEHIVHIPQPNIGSFQFHNNSTITLTNRPLTSTLIMLKNEGAPRTIQRHEIY